MRRRPLSVPERLVMIGCVWEIVAIAFGWPTWTQIHHRLSRHRVLWLVAWFWDGGWDDHFRRRFP